MKFSRTSLYPIYAIGISIIILVLGILDINNDRGFVDPFWIRIILSFLGISSAVMYYVNDRIKNNYGTIFLGLFFMVNIWIYWLAINNNFDLRYLYSILGGFLANSFLIRKRWLLFTYIIANLVAWFAIINFYDSTTLYQMTPVVLTISLAITLIIGNHLKVRQNLIKKTEELEEAKNQIESLDFAEEESNNSSIFLDGNCNVVKSNGVFLINYKLESIKNVNYLNLIKERIDSDEWSELTTTFTTGKSLIKRLKFESPEGDFKWLEIKIKSLESNNLYSFIVIEDDVTAETVYKSEVEEALEKLESYNTELEDNLANYEKALIEIKEKDLKLSESETQLKAILNANPDLIFIQDIDGVYLDVFTDDESQLIMPKEEFLGKSMFDVLPEFFLEIINEPFEKSLNSKQPVMVEYKIPDVEKSKERYFEARLNRYADDKVLTIIRDLTHQKQEEEKYKLTQKRWEFALEGSGDGIWDWNLKTNDVFFSKQWKAMLGFEDHEITASLEEWNKRVHPDDKEQVYADINKHIEGKTEIYINEHRVLNKANEYQWILDRGKVIEFDEENKALRMIGTHTDITKRIENQKIIEEAEQRWKFALEGSGDGIWDWNVNSGEVYYSPKWKSMLGFEDSELENDFSTWEKLVHPDDRDSSNSILTSYFKGKIKTYEIEYRMLTKDGSYKWILTRGKFVEYNDDNSPKRMIGTHTDIDKRVNQDLEIKESQIRFQKLIESISGLFWIKDITNNKMVYMSPNYEKIWGSKIENIYNDPEDFIKPIHKDDLNRVFDKYKKIFEGENFDEDYRIVVNDELKWVNAKTQLIIGQDDILYDYGYAEDITEIKNYQDELIKNSDQLRLTQKMTKIGAWSVDLVKNKVWWSDEVRKIHEVDEPGFHPELADGINYYIPAHREIISKAVGDAIESGSSWDLELQIKTAKDRIIWIRTIGIAQYKDGNPIMLTGAFQDIDEKKKAQEEQSRIFELSIDMICIAGFDGFFKQINSVWTKVLGWSEKELMSKPYIEFVHPDDIENTNAAANQLTEDNPVISFENRYLTKSGEYKWLSWNALPILNESITYAIARDVTDLKLQEEILRDNKNQLEMAQQMAKVGGWKVDLIKGEVIWNAEVKRIHEVPQNFIPTLDEGINFYVPEHRDIISKAIDEGIINLKPWDLELQILTAKGNRKWVRAIGKPEIKDNKVVGLTGTFQDIHENKVAQEEKNKIFDLSIDMICVAGFDGYFKQLNEAWTNSLGWPIQELLNTPFMKFIHPSDMDETQNAVGSLSTGAKLISFENRFQANDGNYRWLSWNALPVPEQGLMYAICRDITDEKQQNYELKKAKDLAESANKSKSAFLANMSHEIRTPMNAILGFGEILKEELETSQHVQYINSIINSGKNLLTLINDILDLSKIEAGKLNIQYSDLPLNSFLNEIKQIFTLKASEKNLVLKTTSNSLPDVIKIDETRLRQILFNLLGNAIKFTHEGSVELKTSAEQISDNHFAITFEVIDTGIGIPESQQAKIFQSFTQQDEQSTRKYGGTGLGLTITKKLVEMMNGEIGVTSKQGYGSNFSVKFNNVVSGRKINKDLLSSNVERRFGTGKILIAEDIDSNYQLLSSILNKIGDFELFWAKSGLEVLDNVEDFNPDLVLMDIQMPEMDGKEAAVKLKEFEKYSELPCVALTALAMTDNVKEFSKFFDGYLTKPIEKDKLIQTLSKYLNYQDKEVKKVSKNKESFSIDDREFINNNKELLLKITDAFEIDFAIEKLEELIELNQSELLDKYLQNLLNHADNFDVESLKNSINELINLSAS